MNDRWTDTSEFVSCVRCHQIACPAIEQVATSVWLLYEGVAAARDNLILVGLTEEAAVLGADPNTMIDIARKNNDCDSECI